MTTSAPVTWHGGKARLASRIIAHFPPHLTYCEPFGGSAAVLLAKQPSEVEIYNDIDGSLTNLFQVLRHPVLFRRLLRALENTLYSRSEFELAQQTVTDPIEAARRLIVRQRQSFGGKGEQWSFCIKDGKAGMSSAIRRWRCGIDQLPEVHHRFKSVQIECADWRVVIERYDAKSSLFFLDPPYHPQTRISGEYKHELSINDHRELVERLLTAQGMLVLCGYYHRDYARLGQYGWKRIEYDVPAHSSDKRTRRVECLWLSPSVVNHEHSRKTPLSPIERMRQGAYHVHKLRIASTTRRVLQAIQKFRLSGKEATIVAVARTTQLSREHLGRKYRHLFM